MAHDLHTSGSVLGPPTINDIDLSPLTPAGIVGGKLAVPIGDDYVFSNDVLLEGLQAFPGQRLPAESGLYCRFRGLIYWPGRGAGAAE